MRNKLKEAIQKVLQKLKDMPEDEFMALIDKYRQPEDPRPVVLDNGDIENFMLRIAGKIFRCSCGANVFHKPDDKQLELYQCNACGTQYEGS